MAQELDLQVGSPQRRFERRDARLGIPFYVAPRSPIEPGVLARFVVLLVPTPYQRLAEVVLAAQLGEALFPIHQLANHLQLELPVTGPLRHRSVAPISEQA